MTTEDRGRLSLEELERSVGSGEIKTVIVAFPDLYGRLMGKRVTAEFFLGHVLEHGLHVCSYLLATGMEMELVSGYRLCGWHTGYGDIKLVPDLDTLRRASWLPGAAIVLADVVGGELARVAPRAVLKEQLVRAAEAGVLPMGAAELEMFLFKESYEEVRRKGYRDLEPFGDYIEDYHILQSSQEEILIGPIREHLIASGIPVETSKGEYGPGQHEINIAYAPLLEAADRTVFFKEICKEVALEQGRAVTFMAKWDEGMSGNSMHIHLSLWDRERTRNLFLGAERIEGMPFGVSDIFQHFLGGLLAHARELSLFFAPTVNSYKRYRPGSFAPTRIVWGYDNRSAGFRATGEGKGFRIECRLPGADANPYLAFSAFLAAGMDGIEKRIAPPPPVAGNAYLLEDVPQVPRSLEEALELFRGSEFVRRAFGDVVVEHYARFAEAELEAYRTAVTDWEKRRYFERI